MADKNSPFDKSTQSVAKTPQITRIHIKYDTGFGNCLFLRGQGSNLSWEKGIPLKNVKSDEWLFETNLVFNELEFKVLINDLYYETGANHIIEYGNTIQYHPHF